MENSKFNTEEQDWLSADLTEQQKLEWDIEKFMEEIDMEIENTNEFMSRLDTFDRADFLHILSFFHTLSKEDQAEFLLIAIANEENIG